SDDEYQKVEKRVSQDAQLQQRVEGLRQTWELLLDLPEEPPNPDLTRSTIELVTLELEQEEQSVWKNLLRQSWVVAGFAALCAFAVGALAGRFITFSRANELQQNLAYIADLESFENVDSEEWLEALLEIEYLTTAFPGRSLSASPVPLEDLEKKQAWIEGLGAVELGLLQDKFQAFSAMPQNARNDLSERVDSVNSDSATRAKKLEAIRSYASLVESAPRGFKNQLGKFDVEQRKAAVQEEVIKKMQKLFAENMSKSDADELYVWSLANSLYDLSPPDFRDEYLVERWQIESLLDKLSDEANALLRRGLYPEDPTSDDDRFAIGTWVYAANNQAVKNSSDDLQQTLLELGEQGNQSEWIEKQRIELLPEEIAREQLQKMTSEKERTEANR
ncbi:MAG: hypothetical protein AAF483_28270, partial [Planctomycetota bacterium]